MVRIVLSAHFMIRMFLVKVCFFNTGTFYEGLLVVIIAICKRQ